MNELTFDMKWCLFRGLVCDMLIAAGYNEPDVWDFASSLDMSFEAVSEAVPLSEWEYHLKIDLEEYKKENPRLFG